jgi:lysosomal Pro-X carboxypeptidase
MRACTCNSVEGRAALANSFKLCSAPADSDAVVALAEWIQEALGFIAMGNFPFPSAYVTNGKTAAVKTM